jgi:tripartite-type tricarboxylate transporter receptor subunit TctC
MLKILPGAALLAGLAGVLIAPVASAQPATQFPTLIRLVVPFPPGGSNDVIARAVAPLLSKRLGNSVIVDNRAGAAGVIGSDTVARAPADASTLLLTSSTFLTTAATQSTVPYDPVSAFAPVAMIDRCAGPHWAIQTPAELIAAASVCSLWFRGRRSIGKWRRWLSAALPKFKWCMCRTRVQLTLWSILHPARSA